MKSLGQAAKSVFSLQSAVCSVLKTEDRSAKFAKRTCAQLRHGRSSGLRTGQAAMEYLVLTGFTILILAILLVAAYSKIGQSQKQIDINLAESAVNEMKRAADFVYIHGHPTKLIISVHIPQDVEPGESFIENNTINIAVRVGDTHTDVWRTTRGDVAGTLELTEGYYTLIVESSEDGEIEISDTS